jgi:integrase
MQLKNDNKSDYTIEFTRKALTLISKHTALSEPEAVKAFIASIEKTDSYKKNLVTAYQHYCDYYQIQWKRPKYQQEARNIALPTKEKLMMIISNCGKLLGTKLQMSMETGLRPVELCNLKVKNIDLEHKTVNPTTAKGGNPRTIPMSANLTQKIQEHIIIYKLNPEDRLFGRTTAAQYGNKYRERRNTLAKKLNDPSIHTIRLYDFRHYFCTKKLYDLNNPYTVMVLMGHKKLQTTQRYMHLLNYGDEEYTAAGATTADEAKKLIEAGFQYITTIEGIQLFRKRK